MDPSFWQWNVTTKKGETLVRRHRQREPASLTLRSPAGDVEVRKEEIVYPRQYPAVADAGGARVARRRGAARHPHLHDRRRRGSASSTCAQAYNADSRRGFRRDDDTTETVPLHRFGDVTVAGVPFFVMDPAKSLDRHQTARAQGGPGTGKPLR